MSGSVRKTDPRTANVRRLFTGKTFERNTRILDLRKAGYTPVEISKEVGVSIHVVVSTMSRWFEAIVLPDLQDALKLELDRLDRYLKHLDPEVEKGSVKAIREAIVISARRAKLLGLDRPTQLEIDVKADEEMVKTMVGVDESRMLAPDPAEPPKGE